MYLPPNILERVDRALNIAQAYTSAYCHQVASIHPTKPNDAVPKPKAGFNAGEEGKDGNY